MLIVGNVNRFIEAQRERVLRTDRTGDMSYGRAVSQKSFPKLEYLMRMQTERLLFVKRASGTSPTGVNKLAVGTGLDFIAIFFMNSADWKAL